MRYRRISYRYTEVVGALSGHFEAELRALVRPQSLASPLWRPHADVLETPSGWTVVLELPGVEDEDMDVAVFPDALVVSGRRGAPRVEGAVYHACEIRYGPFRFDMPLPGDVDQSDIEARAERGLLRIHLPKRSRGV